MRLRKKFLSSVTLFDVARLKEKIDEYEKMSLDDNFWSNQREASKIIDKKNDLINKINLYTKLDKEINDISDLVDSLDINDDEMGQLAIDSFNATNKELKELKKLVLFSGEYDSLDAVLEIHPGAGGTEACDWADMLLRMYERFSEKHGYTFKVLDFLPGDEADLVGPFPCRDRTPPDRHAVSGKHPDLLYRTGGRIYPQHQPEGHAQTPCDRGGTDQL